VQVFQNRGTKTALKPKINDIHFDLVLDFKKREKAHFDGPYVKEHARQSGNNTSSKQLLQRSYRKLLNMTFVKILDVSYFLAL
jgi:hypothetical protein